MCACVHPRARILPVASLFTSPSTACCVSCVHFLAQCLLSSITCAPPPLLTTPCIVSTPHISRFSQNFPNLLECHNCKSHTCKPRRHFITTHEPPERILTTSTNKIISFTGPITVDLTTNVWQDVVFCFGF